MADDIERACTIVRGFRYKQGYSLELRPYDPSTCMLELHTQVTAFAGPGEILPTTFDGDLLPNTITVREILPRAGVITLSDEKLMLLIVGFVSWWETHEMAEWLKFCGDQVFDLHADHVPKVHDERQQFETLNRLGALGDLIMRQRFHHDRLRLRKSAANHFDLKINRQPEFGTDIGDYLFERRYP